MLTSLLKIISIAAAATNISSPASNAELLELPKPNLSGNMAVEEALLRRRSVREYRPENLTLAEISQLMWAAQGVTNQQGLRTAPSAGALYPLEIYLVVGNISGLDEGVYRFHSTKNALRLISESDQRDSLSRAALQQEFIKDGAAMIVISGVYQRTTEKYGQRGIRYVHMEAGHVAQNIFLQATALGLKTAVIGAFNDKAVRKILHFSSQEQPLYLMPVGK